MRYRSPRHRAAPPSPAVTPTPSPDGVLSVEAPVLDHVVRVVFAADIAALDQRAA